MEYIDTLPFKEPPSELCSRAVAKNFFRYNCEDLIAGLPFQALDSLKSCVTPRMLHDMMPFLKQKGVDTRLEWRMHKLRGHISYKYGEDKYSIDELRKEAQNMMSFEDRRLQDDFKIIKRAVDNDHHEFISVHCERLLRDLFCMKSGSLPWRYCKQEKSENPSDKHINEVYEELLYFLPSIVCLKVDLDYLRRLDQEPKIFNILFENLETLILGKMSFDVNDARLTVEGAERIAGVLGKLCRSKSLREISFECSMCYGKYEWDRENVSLILKGLDKNAEETPLLEGICADGIGQFENDTETVQKPDTPYHWDDELIDIAMNKCHKVDQTWTDFMMILKDIDHARKQSHAKDHTQIFEEGNIESVSLCVNCFLYAGKYLPKCKTVRRLSLVGSTICNTLTEGLGSDILTRIAFQQTTHLQLGRIICDNLVARILYIFREYYRKEDSLSKPMELLCLYYLNDGGEESIPVFEDAVCAVRCFRATCSKMSKENFRAFTSFLNKNVCLTHLALRIEQSSAINCVHILQCLMDNTVLQWLDLSGHPITYKDGIKKGDLISRFLRQVKTLKKLTMESCGLVEDTVKNEELLDAIQTHRCLKHLSFKENDLGSAGAEFLSAVLLLKGRFSMTLNHLDLSGCNIPGEDLLAAAKKLNCSLPPNPLMFTLGIFCNVVKGGKKEHAEFKQKIHKAYSNVVCWLYADLFGGCNIPGEDLLAAAKKLNCSLPPNPLRFTLDIFYNVVKGGNKEQAEFKEKIQKAYSNVVYWLYADYLGNIEYFIKTPGSRLPYRVQQYL